MPAPSVITKAETFDHAIKAPSSVPMTAPMMIVTMIELPASQPRYAISVTTIAPRTWVL